MTHGVSGADWRFYKHPLPTSVYDVYMKYWSSVSFDLKGLRNDRKSRKYKKVSVTDHLAYRSSTRGSLIPVASTSSSTTSTSLPK
jgi:hypothetical protein